MKKIVAEISIDKKKLSDFEKKRYRSRSIAKDWPIWMITTGDGNDDCV